MIIIQQAPPTPAPTYEDDILHTHTTTTNNTISSMKTN